MDFVSLIGCMGSMLILLVLGVICYRMGWLNREKNQVLSKLVVYISQPALMTNAILNTDLRLSPGELALELAASVAMYAVLWAIGLVLCRLVAKKEDRGLFHFMTMYGNTGTLGYPVIGALLGPEALLTAALFNVVQPLLMYTHGVMLIAGKGGKAKFSWKLVFNPMIIASFVALIIYMVGLQMPKAVLDTLAYLSDFNVAGVMLILGSTLAAIPLRQVLGDWRTYVLTFVSLILSPVIMWLVLSPVISNPMVLGIAVVLAAMPVANSGAVLCLEYGGDEKVATRGFFLTTVLSLVTIPLMMILLF